MTKRLIIFTSLVLFAKLAFCQDSSALKSEIYQKLRDKRCTTMPLDKCDCPDAREMKAYIDGLIETGTAKEEIFYKVAKKFSLNTILDAQLRADVEKRLIKEIGDDRPLIVLEPDYFNFGEVTKAQGKISKIFTIHNKGKSSLVISSLKASCSCTSVSLGAGKYKSPYFDTHGSPLDWHVDLKPGQTGELEVVLDLGHQSIKKGDLIREISIGSNDPIYPEVKVKVEAAVKD